MSEQRIEKFDESFNQMAIETDKVDLLALLNIRFGVIPPNAKNFILQMSDRDTLERLILVASNVPDWQGFLTELRDCAGAFRIVGEGYRPV